MMLPHPSYIEIDIDQFLTNISAIKKYIGKRRICFAIKANAYGHGIVEMGKAAVLAKIDYLGIANLEEGKKLRENGIFLPIILLGPVFKEQIPYLFQYELEPTISSEKQIEELIEYCKKEKKELKVHFKIDTGLHRTGVCYHKAKEVWNILKKQKHLKVSSIYSHFACAYEKDDEANFKQIERFEKFFKPLKTENPDLIIHMANSGGLEQFPNAMYDMVRIGLLAYGYKSFEDKGPFAKIAPCFSVKSKVCLVKTLEKDEGVSHAYTYITSKKTQIATIPIGYGDGYRFKLSCMDVLIKGKRFPVIGRICMDLIMVDVGDNDVQVGDEVVLIGKQGKKEITLQEIADHLQTDILDVLCGFTDRLERKIAERSREKLSFILDYTKAKTKN